MHVQRTMVRRGIVVPALTLAMVAAALGVMAPAQADSGTARVPGLVRVGNTSPNNSVGKSVTVNCPGATRVYGSGASINGGGGAVVIDRITPNLTLTSVQVTAFEAIPFPGNWSITAYAICGAATLNLQRIHFTSATNSQNKSVVASCPAGLRLYGTGAELNGALGRVSITGIIPNPGLTAVTVNAVENGPFAGNWSVTGYAICANPSRIMTRAAASSAINSVAVKSASATCPFGTRVHGVGGQVDFGLGNVHLTDLLPGPFLGASITTAQERGLFFGNWRVTSYVICAS